MQRSTTSQTVLTMDSSAQEARDVLTAILRHGAQQMLAAAIENEVDEYLAAFADLRDDQGARLVVRNGHTPPRSILTGLGPVEVARPRVNDRRVDADGNRLRFTSKILPPYLRRTKGSGSRTACLTIVFKLALAAEKRWRRLNGSALLPEVIRGVNFVDGIKEMAA